MLCWRVTGVQEQSGVYASYVGQRINLHGHLGERAQGAELQQLTSGAG